MRVRKDIPLPVDIFHPVKGTNSLDATIRRTKLMPTLRHPVDSYGLFTLGHAAKEKPLEYFLEKRGRRLVDRADKAMYRSVGRLFGLAGEKENRVTFYERHMNRANDVILGLVGKLTPGDRNMYGLLDETALIRSPGELLMLLNSPYTDERLRFELTRQVGLALTSAQLEKNKRQSRHRLKEVDSWLDADLFDHGRKIGYGEQRSVTAIHDIQTNKVLYLDDAPDSPGTADTKGERRTRNMRMRYVEGVGYVVSNPRVKNSAETIKKALIMAAEGKNGQQDIVASSVTDRIGMRFAVADQYSNENGGVSALMDKIKAVLVKRYNLPESAFISDDNNNGYAHQENRKSSFRRLLISFPDLDEPLEMLFFAMGKQLDYDNQIGEVDEKGIPHSKDHQAHSLYEISRDLRVFKMLFPSGNPGLYGTIDYDKITHDAYARGIQDLRK